VRFAISLALLAAACEPPGYGKHGADAGIDGTHGDGKSPDAAPDASSGLCDHGFRLDGHGGAASVWLTGDFIAWGGDPAHGATAFTLGNDGGWTGTRSFPIGSYQYKFIVDGTMWIPDPTNPMKIADGFGSFNSLFSCN
jgi:hypothetical protein